MSRALLILIVLSRLPIALVATNFSITSSISTNSFRYQMNYVQVVAQFLKKEDPDNNSIIKFFTL